MTGVFAWVGSSADFSVCIVCRDPGRGSEEPSLGRRCSVCLGFLVLMLFGGLTDITGGHGRPHQEPGERQEEDGKILP